MVLNHLLTVFISAPVPWKTEPEASIKMLTLYLGGVNPGMVEGGTGVTACDAGLAAVSYMRCCAGRHSHPASETLSRLLGVRVFSRRLTQRNDTMKQRTEVKKGEKFRELPSCPSGVYYAAP